MVVSFLNGSLSKPFSPTNVKRQNARKSLLAYAPVFLCACLLPLASVSIAAPTGGNIVGGAGSINQAGLTTNINQLSHSLAID